MRELAFGPAPCRGEATASRQPAFAAEAPSLVLCHSKSRRDTTASLHTCIQGSVLRLFQHAAICPALLPTCWLASPRTVLTYNLQFLNRQRLLQVGLSSPSPGPDPGPAASPAWTLCVCDPSWSSSRASQWDAAPAQPPSAVSGESLGPVSVGRFSM